MLNDLRELWGSRELILMLVRRDLRVRYKNSALGFLWSLAPLLLQTLVISVVVKRIYGVGPHDLTAYVLCAYIPWNFMQVALLDGASSVLVQYQLLKKVYFPRETLPIAAVLSNLVHLLLAIGVFFVYRYVLTPLVFGWPGPPPLAVLCLPLLVVVAFFLVLGITFFTSAMNVFHEDVKFIIQSLLNLAFFALPIAWFTEQLFYSKSIPARWHHPLTVLYNAFPVSWLISAFRQALLPRADIGPTVPLPGGGVHHVVILTAPFDLRYLLLSLVTSLSLAVAGYAYFNRRKWDFVERP